MPRHGNEKWDAAWSRSLSEGAADTGQSEGSWVAQEMEHGIVGPDAQIVAPNNIIAPNNVVVPTAMGPDEEEDLGGGMIADAASDLFLAKTPAPGGPIPIPYPNTDIPDAPEDAHFVADFGFF